MKLSAVFLCCWFYIGGVCLPLLAQESTDGNWKASWNISWIVAPDTSATQSPLPIFRKRFIMTKPVLKAQVSVTALGSYRLSINGSRVGRDILTPEWTDYRKRIVYQVYDVTALLVKGENVLGALLGPGWYGSPLGSELARYVFGPPPLRLALELRVTYKDGTTFSVRSDSTWVTKPGPITSSDIYHGERYDARRELKGWDTPGFAPRASSNAWVPVRVMPPVDITLTRQNSPTIQVTDTLIPVSRTSPKQGTYVYDLGQNIAGWARLKVSGPRGTVVTLRFAEVLDSTGNVYRVNLGRAEATDTYILKGDSIEIFEPHFTYHGFRYVEVTGYPTAPSGVPPQDAILGVVFHTKLPVTGRFISSDSVLNRLWRNIMWGQRANMMSVPTDCPQRAERLGWMGDAQMFWRTASYNMNILAFSRKWLVDIRDAQMADGCYTNVAPAFARSERCGTFGWSDAGIILPWILYRHYGDTSIVRDHWDSMERYMKFVLDSNPDFLGTKPVKRQRYGDWLPAGNPYGTSLTSRELIATAFWAYDARLMAEMAQLLGRQADAVRYRMLQDSVRVAFVKAYVSSDGSVGKPFTMKQTMRPGAKDFVADGVTQTSLLLALHFGLVPDSLRDSTFKRLIEDIEAHDWHLTTGFIGTPYMLPILSEYGRDDIAYRLLFQESHPSWMYMVQKGATTVWEWWDADRPNEHNRESSFNHYALGSVAEWLYRYMAGIDTDPSGPGFKKIIIRPRPNARLTHVRGEYDSVYGTIISDWTLKDGMFTLTATLPSNTTGTIILPNGKKHEVGTGVHRFTEKIF